jgi:hypothetical protein
VPTCSDHLVYLGSCLPSEKKDLLRCLRFQNTFKEHQPSKSKSGIFGNKSNIERVTIKLKYCIYNGTQTVPLIIVYRNIHNTIKHSLNR